MKQTILSITDSIIRNWFSGLGISLCLISFTANSQNVWTQKLAPSTPFTARNACAGFAIGTKGYFGTGGDANGETADWYEYNPATNSWIQKANFGGGIRQAAISFSIGNKGYVGLGDSSGVAVADFWEYDSGTDVWTRKADFPGGARTTAVGFSIGSKGYVGCGDALPGLKKDFYEYDPLNDTWTAKASFGGTARSDANGFSIGTKGYIGVGDDGGAAFKKDFWEYDPSNDTWMAKTNFGGGARSTATAFSLNGMGYIGAGDNGSILKKDFWEWNPTNNAWTLTTNFLGTSRSDMLAFAIGNKAYAGNGNQCGASCYINDWYEFSQSSTSIISIDKQQIKFNLYPNPTNGKLNFDYENLHNEPAALTLYDALGKQVQSYELSPTTNVMSIDLSGLNNGLYYYQVLSNSKYVGGDKLIIMK
jgi:N-acetylneuraminic acid mutarotase